MIIVQRKGQKTLILVVFDEWGYLLIFWYAKGCFWSLFGPNVDGADSSCRLSDGYVHGIASVQIIVALSGSCIKVQNDKEYL